MSSKDSERLRLRDMNAELTKKLADAGSKKEEELSRFRGEKLALQQEVTRNSDDLAKIKASRRKLLRKVDEGKLQSEELLGRLTNKDENLRSIRDEKKELENEKASVERKCRLLEKYKMELKQ